MKKIIIVGVASLCVCFIVFIVYYAIIGHYIGPSQTKIVKTTPYTKSHDAIPPINEGDFVFQGFNPGQELMSRDNSIRTSLGEPIKIDEPNGKDPDIQERIYHYPGYRITTYFIEDREDVGDIYIIERNYRTARGISIGDPAEEVLRKYGQADESHYKGSRFYHYCLQTNDLLDGSYVLEFKISDNIVKQIKFYYYSD